MPSVQSKLAVEEEESSIGQNPFHVTDSCEHVRLAGSRKADSMMTVPDGTSEACVAETPY